MIIHCDMDVQVSCLSPVSKLKLMHRVPYCLQVPLCQFMSDPLHKAYITLDKDRATPKEKASLTIPDPILGLWSGTH